MRLRYRLGAWLLRPYLYEISKHYREQVKINLQQGRQQEAQNCEYIGIGLNYAASPRKHYAS